MPRLENGQRFPEITASVVDGSPMTLPEEIEGVWALLIFYRGHW